MTINASLSSAAKAAGQQLTLDVNVAWTQHAITELKAWLALRKLQGATHMTMEEFRHVAKTHPTSPNAWGTLPVIACRLGLIAPMTHADGSPVMRPAASVKTHAHPIRIWGIV